VCTASNQKIGDTKSGIMNDEVAAVVVAAAAVRLCGIAFV
jgi:hypothetical protein